MKHVAVIDIGKTNAKLALVDLPARAEIAVLTRPNRVLDGPPYPHFDTEGIWAFLCDGLRELAGEYRIEGISITTHGACAALLARDGSLAAPVLDYEHTGPDELRAAYDAIRPDFAETGSPRLPHGLNVGAQLHWQLTRDPGLGDRIGQIVTWPQYWGFRLTGQTATDVCSLGCHTDLWNPVQGRFSALVDKLGLTGRFAAPKRPGDLLGTLPPALQAELALGPVPVLVGIHDSNASLLPHLLNREPPFAVVSTGTWVISMAMGAEGGALDPARDTLVNVNALGRPVPSARFMGGREYEIVREGQAATATAADADRVLARGLMLLPAVVSDSGPFQGYRHRWTDLDRSPSETEVALGYYLALMTAECLNAIGAQGPTLIEGPFAANRWFREMLAAATGRVAMPSPFRTGTAVGAALLFAPPERGAPADAAPERANPRLAAYAGQWHALVSGDGEKR